MVVKTVVEHDTILEHQMSERERVLTAIQSNIVYDSTKPIESRVRGLEQNMIMLIKLLMLETPIQRVK